MSPDQIRAEVARWSVEEQNKLAAWLVHLRRECNPAFAAEISEKLDDQNLRIGLHSRSFGKPGKKINRGFAFVGAKK